MNQILTTKYSKKWKTIFQIQFIISVVLIVWAMIQIISIVKEKEQENCVSKTFSINAKLNTIFADNETIKENIYLGRIVCEKIGLDEYIYNQYTEDNLKILPCKFYGNTLEEDGNICIIGHNYHDNRFFSNLNQLEMGDEIIMKDLNEKQYIYVVYQKYKIDEKDVEQVMKMGTKKEITLCTCTWDKEKRLIIKAKMF